jgi:hypothetical protein
MVRELEQLDRYSMSGFPDIIQAGARAAAGKVSRRGHERPGGC